MLFIMRLFDIMFCKYQVKVVTNVFQILYFFDIFLFSKLLCMWIVLQCDKKPFPLNYLRVGYYYEKLWCVIFKTMNIVLPNHIKTTKLQMLILIH